MHLVEVRLLGNLNATRRHAQSMTSLRQQLVQTLEFERRRILIPESSEKISSSR